MNARCIQLQQLRRIAINNSVNNTVLLYAIWQAFFALASTAVRLTFSLLHMLS
jgi:hypothetical protein